MINFTIDPRINKHIEQLNKIEKELEKLPKTTDINEISVDHAIALDDQRNLQQRIERESLAFGVDNPLKRRDDEMDLPDKREEGMIYLTGHNVSGIGPLHTAYEFKSSSMNKPETISAVNNRGRLAAGYNNATDEPQNNRTLGTVVPQFPYSYEGYWKKLKETAFDFNLDRKKYPADASVFSDGRNSNSFAEGLARCTGGKNSYDMDSLVGGDDYFSCNAYRRR